MSNNDIINDSVNVNKEVEGTGTLDIKFASSNAGDIFNFHKDSKMSDSIPEKDTEKRKVLNDSLDVNIINEISPEDEQLIESQVLDEDVSQETKKVDVSFSNPKFSELKYDIKHECFENPNIGQNRNEYLESNTENFKLNEKEKIVSEAACNANSKIDTKRENLDTLFEDAKNLTSDKNLSKSKIECTASEIVIMKEIDSEMIASIPEKDPHLENIKKIIDNQELKSPEDSLSDAKEESAFREDIESENTLGFDENIILNKNLSKQHMKEVRMLSRDIVMGVIESAINLISDLYTGKAEHLDSTSQLENLDSNGRIKESQEFPFKNTTYNDNSTSEFNGKCSTKNSNNNSDLNNIKIQQDSEITDEDTICGYGCFKPKWIQKYATPRSYLILFSIIGIIHGCYYTYVVSIISTLEKRYAFKTKVSGTLLLADEITPLILGILVGYLGGKTHRPRMVALGMFLSATCCFVSGLPYLIYGTSKHTLHSEDKYKTGLKFCEVGLNNSHCNIDEHPPTMSVVGIFLFASFLKGFATLSYYVIGISYMDDIIKRKNSPMYLAIALALRLLGPLVGFLMSSGFLKYYENPVYDPGFGPDDPRWIGAWWIGFFLQGILLMIFTVPIAFFPRRLPSQKKFEALASASEEGIKEIFRGLVAALKRLGKNPVFIVLIFNTTMKIFGHFGHAISLPKYMEHQFRLSASEASLFSGALSIACIILSTLLGGFLIWKFRPRTKVLLAGMIVSEIILSIGFLILMIPKCSPSEMSHFGVDDEGLILNSACNKNCDCSTSAFTPFCGQDGKTLYFSPCYAGCTDDVTLSSTSKTIKEFGNCSCVAEQQFGTTISEGFCPDENCRSQTIAYLVVLFLMVSITNLFTVASTMILLRSVHPNDKTVALGTFETFICLFGFIPFPVTYGALVDSACLVWEKSCGETGNCWFYDMEKYNYLLHGASALFSALCVVCLVALYFFSSRIRNLYDEEDEVQEDKIIDVKLDTVGGSVTKL